jgi:Tfp pilus assembly protein PilV
MSDRANFIRYQGGSSLLEGLLAIILFSMGLLSLLMLLSATLIESSNSISASQSLCLSSRRYRGGYWIRHLCRFR